MTDTPGARWFFANLVEVKLSRAATDGTISVIELTGPPGDMPPLHLHRTDDEAWYVLEGEMSFHVQGEQPVYVSAGGLAFGPKGVPHTYRVESPVPARWLAVCTPGDFEPFVVAASRPAERAELPPPPGQPSEDEVAAITALAARHQIELLGPPGTLPN
ncbi:MAG TPA: cupin domain-containing protein [Gaiellaceae bacterium]|nr:cupin domain-containing protein [Gaiellaceae bacterium]